MQDLVNRCHLDIKGTNLVEMPKRMNKLKELQMLSGYIVSKHKENGTGIRRTCTSLRVIWY
ncbi:hypothetical protein AHAS_Ahas05G0272600 [Arachis hypogaea]